jgi:hypothetical protein
MALDQPLRFSTTTTSAKISALALLLFFTSLTGFRWTVIFEVLAAFELWHFL